MQSLVQNEVTWSLTYENNVGRLIEGQQGPGEGERQHDSEERQRRKSYRSRWPDVHLLMKSFTQRHHVIPLVNHSPHSSCSNAASRLPSRLPFQHKLLLWPQRRWKCLLRWKQWWNCGVHRMWAFVAYCMPKKWAGQQITGERSLLLWFLSSAGTRDEQIRERSGCWMKVCIYINHCSAVLAVVFWSLAQSGFFPF